QIGASVDRDRILGHVPGKEAAPVKCVVQRPGWRILSQEIHRVHWEHAAHNPVKAAWVKSVARANSSRTRATTAKTPASSRGLSCDSRLLSLSGASAMKAAAVRQRNQASRMVRKATRDASTSRASLKRSTFFCHPTTKKAAPAKSNST